MTKEYSISDTWNVSTQRMHYLLQAQGHLCHLLLEQSFHHKFLVEGDSLESTYLVYVDKHPL